MRERGCHEVTVNCPGGRTLDRRWNPVERRTRSRADPPPGEPRNRGFSASPYGRATCTHHGIECPMLTTLACRAGNHHIVCDYDGVLTIRCRRGTPHHSGRMTRRFMQACPVRSARPASTEAALQLTRSRGRVRRPDGGAPPGRSHAHRRGATRGLVRRPAANDASDLPADAPACVTLALLTNRRRMVAAVAAGPVGELFDVIVASSEEASASPIQRSTSVLSRLQCGHRVLYIDTVADTARWPARSECARCTSGRRHRHQSVAPRCSPRWTGAGVHPG